MTVDTLFRGILDKADQFSVDTTDLMIQRQAWIAEAAQLVEQWVKSDVVGTTLAEMDFRTREGGRQASFSPVPWLRVYVPKYSPGATDGFYIVYLFSADGSAVYLSLNQGTSEWRTGKMRPLRDDAELRARAAAARLALSTWQSPMLGAASTIDLASSTAPVVRWGGGGYATMSSRISWPCGMSERRFPPTTCSVPTSRKCFRCSRSCTSLAS